jgi:hypothetical protein
MILCNNCGVEKNEEDYHFYYQIKAGGKRVRRRRGICRDCANKRIKANRLARGLSAGGRPRLGDRKFYCTLCGETYAVALEAKYFGEDMGICVYCHTHQRRTARAIKQRVSGETMWVKFPSGWEGWARP